MAPPSQSPRAASVLWALCGLDGRLGRQSYWLCFLLMLPVLLIAFTPYRAGLPPEPDLYFVMLAVVAFWTQLATVVKRLHDRGLSGFLALLMLLPLVNLGIVLLVGLLPGDPGPNRFGPHPDSRGRFG